MMLIVNPAAGTGGALRIWDEIQQTLTDLGVDYDYRFTERPGQAVEIARDASKRGYGTLVVVGGDGTVFEAVNGMMAVEREGRPGLGVIPTGRGSDFCRTLEIPTDWQVAVPVIHSGRKRPIDIGSMEYAGPGGAKTAYFANIAGLGFDGEVTERANEMPESLARAVGGIGTYLREKSALFRRAPAWVDRLLDARPLLAWAARRAEMTKARDLGQPTLSMLRGEHGHQTRELDRFVAWLVEQGRPDVICLSNALLAGLARRMKHDLATPVCCTLQDEDAFLDALPEAYREPAWDTLAARAADIDAFLPVSRYYAGVMEERLGLAAGRMHVVPIGIDFAAYEPAAAPPTVPTLGYLAQLRRAGGLDLVVEAFLAIRSRGRVPGVRLRVSGAATPGE